MTQTPEGVLIRPYDPATDYADVFYNLETAGLHDPDRDTEAALAQYADSVIVAEADERVVGNVYVPPGIMPMIFRLVVREDYRRRGIGSLLLTAAENRLREQGHVDAELFMDRRDARLANFYAKAKYHFDKPYASIWRRLDGK